ncbi:MAG: WXG100 family type VII secretion target [Microbacteriaceae bacterium]
MTRYQVDSEAVLSATDAVRTSIGRIQAEVAGLHGQLTNLQGSWTGQAATAFQGVVNEWRATEQRVEENLTALNLALGAAGQTYADIELQNARRFGL